MAQTDSLHEPLWQLHGFRSLLNLDASEKNALSKLQQLQLIEDAQKINTGIPQRSHNTSIKHAWIEVTKKCNHRCIHCYDDSAPQQSSKMTIEAFKHVIDEIQKEGIHSIQLIGGEPLCLGHNLKEMLDYAYGKFSKIEIFTNGTLITNDWIEVFKKNKIYVAISIHSYNPKMHDYVTQVSGSFEKAKNNIQKLKNHLIPYRVANVLVNGCELGERDTDLFTLDPDRDVVRMSGRGSNTKLLNKELIKKRMISKNNFLRPLNANAVNLAFSFNRCFCAKIYVDTELNVFPCVMERRVAHGNLKFNSLKNILRQDLFELNKDKIETCSVCEFRYTCSDCRPDSMSDNMFAKPWYCTYDPYSGKWEDEEIFIARILNLSKDKQ